MIQRNDALLSLYLSYDPKVGKGFSGWLDFVAPGLTIGLLIGMLGWDWSNRKLTIFTIIGGIVLVALFPLYVVMLKTESIWWWPRQSTEIAGYMILKVFEAVLLIGVFCYQGRLIGKWFRTNSSGNQ
jgi:hypothetical protein